MIRESQKSVIKIVLLITSIAASVLFFQNCSKQNGLVSTLNGNAGYGSNNYPSTSSDVWKSYDSAGLIRTSTIAPDASGHFPDSYSNVQYIDEGGLAEICVHVVGSNGSDVTPPCVVNGNKNTVSGVWNIKPLTGANSWGFTRDGDRYYKINQGWLQTSWAYVDSYWIRSGNMNVSRLTILPAGSAGMFITSTKSNYSTSDTCHVEMSGLSATDSVYGCVSNDQLVNGIQVSSSCTPGLLNLATSPSSTDWYYADSSKTKIIREFNCGTYFPTSGLHTLSMKRGSATATGTNAASFQFSITAASSGCTANPEAFYLANNADVQANVATGTGFQSGYDHWCQHGYSEGRQNCFPTYPGSCLTSTLAFDSSSISSSNYTILQWTSIANNSSSGISTNLVCSGALASINSTAGGGQARVVNSSSNNTLLAPGTYTCTLTNTIAATALLGKQKTTKTATLTVTAAATTFKTCTCSCSDGSYSTTISIDGAQSCSGQSTNYECNDGNNDTCT